MEHEHDDLDARIKARAYEIWEQQGQPDGMQHEHWLIAEHEIKGNGALNGKKPPTAPDDEAEPIPASTIPIPTSRL